MPFEVPFDVATDYQLLINRLSTEILVNVYANSNINYIINCITHMHVLLTMEQELSNREATALQIRHSLDANILIYCKHIR